MPYTGELRDAATGRAREEIFNGPAEELAGRVRDLGSRLAALDEAKAALAAERGTLMRELHESCRWTTRQIAAAAGLSQPRVQQILNAARGIHPAGWGHATGGQRD